ncbi:MAG: M23 family metallopeptidase [Alphaproteobacteria bacterium]|nr:M23 family metallopeptidase [Alphaproteobacteria bacterium]
MRLWLVFTLLLWPWAALAEAPVLTGNLVQGGLVHGRAAPGTRVEFDGRAVRLSAKGTFIIGFGRDFPGTAPLYWYGADGKQHSQTLTIKARHYRVQRIDGLPKKMVTPPREVLARIRRENGAIGAVRAKDSPTPWHESGFLWPLRGRISGVYGSQRILNGKPRRPHFGLDIAAKTGSPVHASTDGMVALAEGDLYYTGGTVMLDHGHGLTSVYSHLQSVTVKPGQFVRQGQRIGTLGATGRATGPHLDWRLNWFKQRLDPALLVGPMPKP